MNILLSANAIVSAIGFAPAYASGVSGFGLLLGQPSIGSMVSVLDGILVTPGNPTPTTTYQWYRGDSQLVSDPGIVITGATLSTYTPGPGDIMKMLWCVITHTNSVGSASCTTWKTRCIPAGVSIGQGHVADAEQINDPAIASAYNSTILYQAGDIAIFNSMPYLMRQPYSCGIDNSDEITWQIISHAVYIDSDNGNDSIGNGTSGNPYQTLSKIHDILSIGGNSANTIFLLKRGTTAHYVGSLFFQGSGGAGCGVGVYGTGARPKWDYAPPNQAQATLAGFGDACVVFNKSNNNSYTFNIDFDGKNIIVCPITTSSISNGPFAIGDVITFAAGMSGVVDTIFTQLSGTVTNLALIMTSPIEANFSQTGNVTSGLKSGTIRSAIVQMGGVLGNGGTNFNYGIANCSFVNFTQAAWDPNCNTDYTKGNCFLFNCFINRCGTCIQDGAAIGGAGTNIRMWFCTILNGGIPDDAFCHQIYMADLSDSSVLFNNIEMTADYGNTGFNCHGNSDTCELAFNIIKGARSGIGINDGYGTGEQMYRWHIHHNLIRDIGTGMNQSTQSLGWFISCLQQSRIHDNVTIDCIGGCAFFDERTHGVGNTQLGNTVIGFNSFWNTSVFFGSTANGANCSLITNLTLENNIWSGSSAVSTLIMGNTMPLNQLTENYNLFYRTDAGAPIIWSYGLNPINYPSASALNAIVPTTEINGKTGNPNFVNITTSNENLSLQSNSIAKLSGTDLSRALGYSADFTFSPRNLLTPSIGAYE